MAHRVHGVGGIEILDSRGRPTVQVTVRLEGGATGVAGVPSGASTGSREAQEIRDGDAERFDGLGARRAVMTVEGEIAEAVVADDNSGTNPAIIQRAIDAGMANAAPIKLNQVGTVTEVLEAIAVCRAAKYAQMISQRSGETTDAFIADLAFATGCGQLKSGAPARGERVAESNRLLEIELTEPGTPYGLAGSSRG
jgi:enolase